MEKTAEVGESQNQEDSEKLEDRYVKRVTEHLIGLLSAPGVFVHKDGLTTGVYMIY